MVTGQEFKDLIDDMLKLMHETNTLIDPEWYLQGNNWVRAARLEASEIFEHLPWKWWKDTSKKIDMAEVHIELIDIWHFLSSKLTETFILKEIEVIKNTQDGVLDIESNVLPKVSSFVIQVFAMRCSVTKYAETAEDVMDATDDFLSVLHNKQYDIYDFFPASFRYMDLLGMSFEELYQGYVYKNTLNVFRQKNGYKDSTYVKHWKLDVEKAGYKEVVPSCDVNITWEDNYWLNRVRDKYPAAGYTQIYAQLDWLYSCRIN